jgi:transglutaminase-like putative cysteine protease
MLYAATHRTSHAFELPVSQCVTELRLTPRSLPRQHNRETVIDVHPAPNVVRSRKDYFGNDVTTVEVFEPHNQLIVKVTSIVEVSPPKVEAWPPVSWEETRDLLARCPDAVSLKALEFVFDSPLVSAGEELAEFAQPAFSSGRPLLEAVQVLSQRIRSEFDYLPKPEAIRIPLSEILRNRQGTGQDFAHVMIGALRSLGLAARYVSGYPRCPAAGRGVEAAHAWVAVFAPGNGWVDFDPANGIMPADGQVTLAWGRDYGDVAPVNGIITGGGKQAIEVEITVRPIEDEESGPNGGYQPWNWRLSA